MVDVERIVLDESVGVSRGWIEVRMHPSSNLDAKQNKPYYDIYKIDRNDRHAFPLARVWAVQGIVFRNRKGDVYDYNPLVLDVIDQDSRTEETALKNAIGVARELAKQRGLGIIENYSEHDKRDRQKLVEAGFMI